jgi:hypothetical protein
MQWSFDKTDNPDNTGDDKRQKSCVYDQIKKNCHVGAPAYRAKRRFVASLPPYHTPVPGSWQAALAH